MTPKTHIRGVTAAAVAGCALLVAPAFAQADLVITAKSFSTQEAAPLSRTILATFSDDAAGAPGSFSCSASTYTGTVDWGDGSAPEPVNIADRFGGDFALCAFTITGDHKYAHFGVFTTTVSISGGPLGHAGTDTGQITVADVGIAGEGKDANATTGTPFVGEVAEFKDQNQLSSAGDFTASIDWGDATPITTGVITGNNGNFSVSGTHTYASAGSFAVRTTFSHPTAAPAVALSTMTVGAAAPPNNQNNNATQFTGVFSVRGTAARQGITLKALKSPGLAVRIGAAAARTETIEVLRNTSKLGSTKVKVKAGVNNVRWRPSSALAKKLRSGRQYGLRIKVAGEPTLQLTFRIRAQR
jgi:hypothetical protein